MPLVALQHSGPHHLIPCLLLNDGDLSAAPLVGVAYDAPASDESGGGNAVHLATMSTLDPDGFERAGHVLKLYSPEIELAEHHQVQ